MNTATAAPVLAGEQSQPFVAKRVLLLVLGSIVLLLKVDAESIRWYRGQVAGRDAVLNACRALRFAAKGVWSSKLAAGTWALERHLEPRLVAQALPAGQTEQPLSRVDVVRLLSRVERIVRVAATRERLEAPGLP